jgi:hypothetical protein
MPSAASRAIPWSEMPNHPQNDSVTAQPPARPYNPMPTPQGDVGRSSVLIAALPGVSTQSDGVIRQYYGGSAVPKGRIFVP